MHVTTWRLAAAGCLLVGFSSVANAAILVNDRWADGTDSDPASPTYSEMGVDGDADTDLESAWFQGGGGTLDPTGAGGPLAGSVSTGSSSWTTYFTPEASPVTLANTGDSLRVTWTFTPRTVNAGNTSQDFRLAVVDSPAATRLAANGAPGSGTYSGYSMFMNMGPTLGNSNPFQLREHDGNGALLSGSGDWLALANGVATGATGYASDTQYTYVMTLTRNASSGLDIVSTMSGGSIGGAGTATVSFTDTTPSFTFDTFTLRPSSASGTAAQFDTSLFRVEVTAAVPEPATLSLCGIAALAALAVGRRK
ncbi:hypothetical protein [Lacipirellula parvula]|uniref:PEP-CTERM protein-sorting domain-containing protein n=1 Tax=Lacipirellula parvula TaxID=2650471 RepID=A0A5K7XM42_9BACT|nr:hypothetical protein [Lacipirellula parvula]BBO35806.1 hypothetical protein PLANPX_5418 [Lacipirellula parvula]